MKKTFSFEIKINLSKLFNFMESRWFNLFLSFIGALIAYLFISDPGNVPDAIIILLGVGYLLDSLGNFWLFLSPDSEDTPVKETPHSVGRSEEIKALFEYIRTRAIDLESVQAANDSEAFPLWVNISEIQELLSMYHNGKLMEFLNKEGLCYDHGFGCDADDYKFPEFPEKIRE